MAGLRGTELKKKLRSGKPVLGAWLQLADPVASEVMSRVGFDLSVAKNCRSKHHATSLSTMVSDGGGTAE